MLIYIYIYGQHLGFPGRVLIVLYFNVSPDALTAKLGFLIPSVSSLVETISSLPTVLNAKLSHGIPMEYSFSSDCSV